MAIRREDKDLREIVTHELDGEPKIDSSEIGVTVSNGIVTLSGLVSSYAQKRVAEEAILICRRRVGCTLSVRGRGDVRLYANGHSEGRVVVSMTR